MTATDYYSDLGTLTPSPAATAAQQTDFLDRFGQKADLPSETNGLLALLKTMLEQMKDDRAITPQLWTDDTDTYFYRMVSFNQSTNAFEYSNVDLTGAAYTIGANPRPFGADASADKEYQLRECLYDDGVSTGLEGFVSLEYDASTNPTTTNVLGVLSRAFAPVAAPTNIRERPATVPVNGTITPFTLNFTTANPEQLSILPAAPVAREVLSFDWSVSGNAVLTLFFGTTEVMPLRNVRAFEKSHGDRVFVIPANQALIVQKSGTNNTRTMHGAIITRELA